MNKLLSRQRKWLVITLLIEALIIGVLVILYYNVPDFNYYYLLLIGFASFFILFDFFLTMIFNFIYREKKGKAELKAAGESTDPVKQLRSYYKEAKINQKAAYLAQMR